MSDHSSNRMDVRTPKVINFGLVAFHDQACAVYCDKHAVFDCNTGVFYPSWEAMAQGWRLVRAKSWMQKVAIKLLFPECHP